MKKFLLGMAKSVTLLLVGMFITFGAFWIGANNHMLVEEAINDIQCIIHENEPVNYITVAEDINKDGVMEESHIYYNVE